MTDVHHAFKAHMGVNMRSAHSPPPPPLTRYEEWFAKHQKPRASGWKRHVTAATLRRAVILIREGYDVASVERKLGFSSIGRWLAMLPSELAA